MKEAFRATFEEAATAELILLVVDISDPDAASQIEIVQKQLNDLGAGSLPVIYVLNKMDKMKASAYHDVMMILRNEKAKCIVPISAVTGAGVEDLVNRLSSFVEESFVSYRAHIPYRDAGMTAHAREYGSVKEERYEADFIVLEGRIRKSRIGPLLPFIV